MMATVRKTPRPKAAVAIPLNMFDSNPCGVLSMLRGRYAITPELVLNGLFIFCLGSKHR
jgi:hypothetical protein